jgi:hypothetical protein
MNINLSISAAPGISNFLIAAVYEASNPNVVVAYHVLPKPLLSDVNFTFTDLDPVVYYVRIWENSTDVPGGSIRHQFIYDPEYGNATVTVREDLFLTVGAGEGNPVAGEDIFTRDDLQDWSYTVERRGFGSMEPGVDVSISLNRKTISLIKEVDGQSDIFGEGEVFILHFEPKIVTNQPIASQASGKLYSSTETIENNRTLIAADIGKVFLLKGQNDTLTVTLPSINLMPENRHFAFVSEGGSHKVAIIMAAGSDTIEFAGIRNNIYLGQSERIWIYAKGGVWIVSIASGSFDRVGEVFMSYDDSVLNALPLDGRVLDRVVYARLWEWVQTLDVSMIVTDTNWSNPALNNYGRFSFGDGSTTFRIPQMHAPGFVRAVNSATRKAGSYEAGMVGPHTHPSPYKKNDSRGGDQLNTVYDGNDGGPYSNASAIPADPTAIENRPANIGIYFMIRC